jgi:hypothetical protein
MDDSPSETFPTTSISATRPQEWTVLVASRYFTISRFQMIRVPCLQDLRTPNPDMSMGSQYLAHVSQLTDGLDPISGFRNLRFPDDKVLLPQIKGPQLSGFDGPGQFLANRQFAFRGFEKQFPLLFFWSLVFEIYVSQIQQLKAPRNPMVWILFLVNQDFTVREIRKQFSSLFQLPSS